MMMADQNPEKDSFFKEIDEELRQESYAKLWKKYGKYLIGIAVIFVASVAAHQGWKGYDLSNRGDDSALYASALNAISQNKTNDATSVLASLTKDSTTGYSILAQLNQAGLIARSGDATGAAAAYLSIANDTKINEIFRDLALILSTMHNLDNGDPVELTNQIQHLILPSNPWRHTAKELVALLAQKSGNIKQAGQLYKELADDVTAPAGIRARAAEMSAISGN